MNCQKCNCSVNDRPLMRVNPKGEKGIFWCHHCVAKFEPELYKNEIEEMSPVEKDLIDIIYHDVRL